jgi:hypothetical protein
MTLNTETINFHSGLHQPAQGQNILHQKSHPSIDLLSIRAGPLGIKWCVHCILYELTVVSNCLNGFGLWTLNLYICTQHSDIRNRVIST